MDIEFDPTKDASNKAKHGLALGDFDGFDGEMVAVVDDRRDYGEKRFRAFGRIEGLCYSIAYTLRGARIRLISFRRAHEEEMESYE